MKVIKNGYPWCSRWYIEIYESAYCSSTGMDYEAKTRVYVYPDCSHDCDIIKCLKKVWKHYNKLAFQKMKEHDFRINIDVLASVGIPKFFEKYPGYKIFLLKLQYFNKISKDEPRNDIMHFFNKDLFPLLNKHSIKDIEQDYFDFNTVLIHNLTKSQ